MKSMELEFVLPIMALEFALEDSERVMVLLAKLEFKNWRLSLGLTLGLALELALELTLKLALELALQLALGQA